jgi:hypothetical protein
MFVALNPGALPARPRSPAELFQWVCRDEEYATLGANVVVELNSESHARRPTTRAWAIIRRAERAHRNTSDRQGRGGRRQADRATRSDRTSRSHQPEERGMVADALRRCLRRCRDITSTSRPPPPLIGLLCCFPFRQE